MKWLKVVLVILSTLCTTTYLAAQQQPANKQEIEEIRQDVSGLKREFKEARKSLEDGLEEIKKSNEAWWKAVERTGWIATILAFMFALILGAPTLFYAWYDHKRNRAQTQERNEDRSREKEIHQKFVQMLDMELGQKSTNQAAVTLGLINNLLTITRDTAQRVSSEQRNRLVAQLAALHERCLTLINDAKQRNDRDLVARPEFRERVRIAASLVDDTESQIRNGAVDQNDAGLSLPAACVFIRGAQHYLLNSHNAALDAWKGALTSKESEKVAFDCNYWLAYLNGNLGQFDAAAQYLDAARGLAPLDRRVETARMALENNFFRQERSAVLAGLQSAGAAEYQSFATHEHKPEALSAFASTIGNITMVEEVRRAREKMSLDKAIDWFELALMHDPSSRWAGFGRYQCKLIRGDSFDDTDKQAVRLLIDKFQQEFLTRIEDRSKILSQSSEYICRLILGEKNGLPFMANSIVQSIPNVTSTTIYSQLRKQPIGKSEYFAEFKHLSDTNDLRAATLQANAAA